MTVQVQTVSQRGARGWLLLGGGIVLTVVSFAGSYTHCVEMVRAHGQSGAMAFVIAAMPEVSVFLCLLALIDGRRGAAVVVVGASSFAFTIVANGSTAGPGPLGMAVALWPAWSAIGALWLTGGHQPTRTKAPARETRPAKPTVRTATPAAPEPAPARPALPPVEARPVPLHAVQSPADDDEFLPAARRAAEGIRASGKRVTRDGLRTAMRNAGIAVGAERAGRLLRAVQAEEVAA